MNEMTDDNKIGFGTIPDARHIDQDSTVMVLAPNGGYQPMQQAQLAPTQNDQQWAQGEAIGTPAQGFGGVQSNSPNFQMAQPQPQAVPQGRAMMPGFTSPSAPSPAPQTMQPYGAPQSPSSGTAARNLYLQGMPQVQTASGTPYDRVLLLQNQHAIQQAQQQAMMQAARRQDSSPLAFLRRGLAGFSGRPLPMSAQQQALGVIQAQGAGGSYNDALLKAVNDGQGSMADLLKGQHELAGDYNTASQNDNASAQNDRDFGLKQNQFAAGQKQQDFNNNMTQKNFGLAQGSQNLDQQKLQAQIAQQHAELGLEAQKAMQTGNIAHANLAFQKQKALQDYSLQLQQHGWNREDNQAQYVYTKDGIPVKDAQGNPVPKYKYDTNSFLPMAKPNSGGGGLLDPLAKAFGYVPQNSQTQQPAQAQSHLPQPTKTNSVLDTASAQAYMNQYGNAVAARAAALADGWRTK
jgi:hypothetical protein